MPDNAQEPINQLLPVAPAGGAHPANIDAVEEDEEALKKELLRITPSNEQLRRLAKKYPPPPEYFEGEEEMPFVPVEE
jgi:hypothetical protein